jgi:hypothetical protein
LSISKVHEAAFYRLPPIWRWSPGKTARKVGVVFQRTHRDLLRCSRRVAGACRPALECHWYHDSLARVKANVQAWFEGLSIANAFTGTVAGPPPLWLLLNPLRSGPKLLHKCAKRQASPRPNMNTTTMIVTDSRTNISHSHNCRKRGLLTRGAMVASTVAEGRNCRSIKRTRSTLEV